MPLPRALGSSHGGWPYNSTLAWLGAMSQLHLHPSQIKPEARAETHSSSKPMARWWRTRRRQRRAWWATWKLLILHPLSTAAGSASNIWRLLALSVAVLAWGSWLLCLPSRQKSGIRQASRRRPYAWGHGPGDSFWPVLLSGLLSFFWAPCCCGCSPTPLLRLNNPGWPLLRVSQDLDPIQHFGSAQFWWQEWFVVLPVWKNVAFGMEPLEELN